MNSVRRAERLHRMVGRLTALFLLGAWGGSAGCAKKPLPTEQNFRAMDTEVSVSVPPDARDLLPLAVHLTRDLMGGLHKLVSLQQTESEVFRLNQTAATIRLPVSRDIYRLLSLAQEYTELTDGAFDVTVEPVAELWGFEGGRIPAEPLASDLTRAALAGVGHQHVELYEEGAVKFTSPYTKVNLEGIARSYAVDLSIVQLRQKGLKDLLLNLGGRYVRCLGQAGEASPWTVPLYNPLAPEEQVGTVRLPAGSALATTRLYDNFVTIAGQRFGYIIDPRTGQPARGTAEVSVIAPTATEAYALSLALVVLGEEEGQAILGRLPRSHVLLMPDREPLEIRVSQGFEEWFDPGPGRADAIRSFSPEF